MGVRPIRLTIVATHPVQYASPWFRYISDHCPQIDLTVLYASRPSAAQQGAGFDRAFEWDLPLLEGYRSIVVRESRPGDAFESGAFRGLDVPEIVPAMIDTRPEIVLISGWHSVTQLRAIRAARAHGIPVVYRGDSHLGMTPTGWRRFPWRVRTRARLGLVFRVSGGRQPVARVSSRARCGSDGHLCVAARGGQRPVRGQRGAASHRRGRTRLAARTACGARPSDFVVLFAGKLVSRKRPIDAIRAAARLGPGAHARRGRGSGELEGRSESGSRIGSACALRWRGFVNQSGIARATPPPTVSCCRATRANRGASS